MHKIKETDWKLLKRVHPLALERFCERVLAEVNGILHESFQSYPERYRKIFKIMRERDRGIARIFNNPRRSQALTMLAQMRHHGLLTEEEFSSLSADAQDAIDMTLGTLPPAAFYLCRPAK